MNPYSSCGHQEVVLYHYECLCGLEGWSVVCWRCYTKGTKGLMSEKTAETAVNAWNEAQHLQRVQKNAEDNKQ